MRKMDVIHNIHNYLINMKNYFEHFKSNTLPKVKTYFSRVWYGPQQWQTPSVGVPVAQSTEDPRYRISTGNGEGSSVTNTTVIYGGYPSQSGDGTIVMPEARRDRITLGQTRTPFAILDGREVELSGMELNAESLRQLASMFEQKGVPVRITSLERPGAVTSNGSTSYHALGKAMDIVPVDNDFNKLRELMITDPDVIAAMDALGLGFIDETSQEMLRRTGGTGPHFHVAPDRLAIQHYQSLRN